MKDELHVHFWSNWYIGRQVQMIQLKFGELTEI